MRMVKAVMLIALAGVFGCQDDVDRGFPPIKVAVNDTNELTISDSIYYIVPDALPNKVTVLSEVPDADLTYSVNSSANTRIPIKPITLQAEDTVFCFFLTRSGFEDSETKTIVFQSRAKKYLDRVAITSLVSDSNLNLSMKDKSRGMLEVEIFTVTGKRLLHRNHVKNTDEYVIKYALEEYPRGIYFVTVAYGQDRKAYRFIKE